MIVMSDSQLRSWAYHPDRYIGMGQDFELLVSGLHRADIILECASDNQCPKQLFFLICAYLIVGDAIRSQADCSVFVVRGKEVLLLIRRAEKRATVICLNTCGEQGILSKILKHSNMTWDVVVS